MIHQVFIGHDAREQEAYRVCVRSLAMQSKNAPLAVMPISSRLLGAMYRRPTEKRNGILWDAISDAPMSTEFSIARFFAPRVALPDAGWIAFCDCDFLWRAPISDLLSLADDRYAVMCVKHEQRPIETIKMDGQPQTAYERKNWSSLMLINCRAPEVQALTLDALNARTGRHLHGFEWVSDERIGALPVDWNWLSGVNTREQCREPKAVHFTLGTPDLPGYESHPFADEWRSYAGRTAS